MTQKLAFLEHTPPDPRPRESEKPQISQKPQVEIPKFQESAKENAREMLE